MRICSGFGGLSFGSRVRFGVVSFLGLGFVLGIRVWGSARPARSSVPCAGFGGFGFRDSDLGYSAGVCIGVGLGFGLKVQGSGLRVEEFRTFRV